MNDRRLLTFFVAVATLMAGSSVAADKKGLDAPPPNVVKAAPGVEAFYVRFRRGRGPDVAQAVRDLGGDITHRLDRIDTFAVLLPEAAAVQLRANPNVALFEKVPVHQPLAQVVPWNIDMVQARDVWDVNRDGVVDSDSFDGSGVKFCIIDTGFFAAHDDFQGITASGESQIIGESWTEDGNGHGTHVAGTANAVNNDIGVVGVMPGGAELYIVKLFDNSGAFVTGQSNLADAAQACADAGANAISMSLGGGASSTEEALFQDLYDNSNIISIAAAGNDGDATRSYPASYDSVISVAALKESEQVADFSQFPGSSYEESNPPANVEWDTVELSGGGENVLSTFPSPDGEVPVYQVEADGVTYSANVIDETSTGTVTASNVDGGLCDAGDIDASWNGAVVICQRGNISFADKINNVGNAGGLAAIIYNNASGNFNGTCGGNCTVSIPGVSLSQEDGLILLADSLGSITTVTADDGSGCTTCTGGYAYLSGTSMATPGVAAGIAWAWDACGGPTGISNKELRQLLRDSARDLSGTREAGGSYGAGYDPYTGFGLIQLKAAQQLGNERFGSTCPVAVSVDPYDLDVCTNPAGMAQYDISLGGQFTGDTDLSVSGLPGAVSGSFAPNPVSSPATSSVLTLSNLDGVATGNHELTIRAEDAADADNFDFALATLNTFADVPGDTTLTAPVNGATGQALQPTFTWDAASDAGTYTLEIATDSSFTSVVYTATNLTETSHTPGSELMPESTYYWRVTATNACGDAISSAVNSFTTTLLYCSAPAAAIPDNNATGLSDTLSLTAPGTLTDLNVWITADHTWVGDLSAELTHAATGTTVALFDRPGKTGGNPFNFGCAEDDIDAILDDSAATAAEDACDTGGTAMSGPLSPDELLSGFNTETLAGDWTLTISDAVSGDTGTLQRWCLEPTVTGVASADLAITKTDGQTSDTPGTTVTYTITATNNGPDDVTGATVADTFPTDVTGVTWTCATSGTATCTASGSGNISDTVDLANGASVTYTATGTIASSATGTLSNTATVTAPSGVSDTSGNNSATDDTTLTPSADLAITKTDAQDPVSGGSDIVYTVSVTNNGPSDAATLVVTDTLPAGVTYQSATGTGWSCSENTGVVTCSLASLAASASSDVTITVSAPTAEGTITNNASVSAATADPSSGNDSASEDTSVDNLAPTANADSMTVNEGGTATTLDGGAASVIDNDTDPEGDTLTVNTTPTAGPSNGSLTLNADGTFSYTHDGSETTSDSFTYEVCDTEAQCDTATVSITVNAQNDPPTAIADSDSTDEDTAITTVNVLDNDSDPDTADTLSVSGLDLTGTQGSVTDNGDGTFAYDPSGQFDNVAAGATATDTFTYTVSDGNGGTDTATVTITINGVNDAPAATADSGTTDEDTPFTTVDVLGNDSDAEGQALSVSSFDTTGTVGQVTDNGDGTFDYDPNGQFENLAVGETATDAFAYTVSDGNGGTDTATVTVTINGVNDGPTATADSDATDEDTPFTTVDVLSNDSDPDGNDTLSVSSFDTTGTVGQVTDKGDGTFDYDPNGQFENLAVGETATDTFAYTVSDGNGGTDSATVTITINGVNDAPVATGDGLTVDEAGTGGGNVLTNDNDVDGGALTASLASGPSNGNATVNPDGTFSYTHDGSETTSDSFTYTVSDGNGGTGTGTVTITINPLNDAPTAGADSDSTDEDTAIITVNVLDNDSDPDTADTLSVSGLDLTGTQGSVSNNGDGTFAYDPNGQFDNLAAGAIGTDTFTYTVSDGNGGTDTATVTITINGVNDAPAAAADSGTTDEDTPFTTVDVLGNDNDAEGQALSVSSFDTTGTVGQVTDNGDGTFDYDPNGQFENLAVGETTTDTFAYTVSDGNGGTDTATVTVTINGVNDAPVATGDSLTVDEAGTGGGNVLSNDNDPDGGDLTASLASGPANGTATVNADGSFSYTHDGSETTSDSFTYTVSDGNGGADTGTVTITVNPVNQSPAAAADALTVDEGGSGNGDVLSNDNDPDGDNLTATLVSGPGNGALTLNGDGTFSYTHDGSETRSDSFTYRACDAAPLCDSATVTITVIAVNDDPVAVSDSASGIARVAITGNVSGNDSDPEDDPLGYSVDSNPANGVLSLNSDGSFSYTSSGSFTGVDTFSYRVSDGNGGSAIGDVAITVSNNAPIAGDDSFSMAENTTLNEDVSGNDGDGDGGLQGVSFSGPVTGPANGTVMISSDGTFSYTPDPDFSGTDSFTYQVSDGVETATATVTVDVLSLGVSTLQVAGEAFITDYETTLNGTVADNDVDSEGGALSYVLVNPPAAGQLTLNTDGTFEYVPPAGFENLVLTFGYQVSNGTDTAEATAEIRVGIVLMKSSFEAGEGP